jgi:hypothetical protein
MGRIVQSAWNADIYEKVTVRARVERLDYPGWNYMVYVHPDDFRRVEKYLVLDGFRTKVVCDRDSAHNYEEIDLFQHPDTASGNKAETHVAKSIATIVAQHAENDSPVSALVSLVLEAERETLSRLWFWCPITDPKNTIAGVNQFFGAKASESTVEYRVRVRSATEQVVEYLQKK